MGGTRSIVHLSYPVSVASMSHSSELRWWIQVIELEVGVREMRIFIGRYLRIFILFLDSYLLASLICFLQL